MSSDESLDEESSSSSVEEFTSSNEITDENGSELDRLKRECRAMVTLLKRLREEEEDLRDKNVMLAREALLCGFQMESLEAPPPKRRIKANTVHKLPPIKPTGNGPSSVLGAPTTKSAAPPAMPLSAP